MRHLVNAGKTKPKRTQNKPKTKPNQTQSKPKQTQSNPISNQTSIAVQRSKRYNIDTDGLLNPKKRPLKSQYGGERFRPDGRKASCMSRTPVGLAKHPATNLIGNYQLRMAA